MKSETNIDLNEEDEDDVVVDVGDDYESGQSEDEPSFKITLRRPKGSSMWRSSWTSTRSEITKCKAIKKTVCKTTVEHNRYKIVMKELLSTMLNQYVNLPAARD